MKKILSLGWALLFIYLVLGSTTGPDRVDTDDEIAFKHEKLTEAGKLAVEHLKAIVG